MKDKILIVSGDPNSINSEIIYKVWKNLNSTLRKKIYFISNFRLIKSQFKKLNYSCKVVSVNDINEKSKFLKIIKGLEIILPFPFALRLLVTEY